MRRGLLLAVGLVAVVPISAVAELSPPPFLLQWGTPGQGPGQFTLPIGIAVGPDGSVYTSDYELARVQKFTSSGGYVTGWTIPLPPGASYRASSGIAVSDADIVYVADWTGNRILEYSATGSFGAAIGEGDLSNPWGVAARGLDLWVADYGHNMVRHYMDDGSPLGTWGNSGCADGQIRAVAGMAPQGSDVFVTDYSDRVQRFDASGGFEIRWGPTASCSSIFPYPLAVTADAEAVYVVDPNNHVVRKFSSDGVLLSEWGSLGSGPGQFRRPMAVAVDGLGNVYVADTDNFRIQKFGRAPTPATGSSWGRIKALYR